MNKFELHIEGKVIPSEDLAYLKEVAKATGHPYFIFKVFQSKMNIKEIKIPKNRVPRVYKKMTSEQIEEAARHIDRGYDKKMLTKKYHVSLEYLNIAIKDYQSQNKTTT